MERLRDRLSLVAEGDREEEVRAAQRLIATLDDSVRLMLLDVLAAAAAEITRELAPGSVELRLRGSEPEFVVTTPAPAPASAAARRRRRRGGGDERPRRRSARWRHGSRGGRARADQPAAARAAQGTG